MRILVVTFHFPPANTIAAVRLGKLANWLLSNGHEVKVITATNPEVPENLCVDFPKEHVYSTDWYDINGWAKRISTNWQALRSKLRRQTVNLQSVRGHFPNSTERSTKTTVGQVFQHITNWPDRHIGWLPFVVGNRTLRRLDWNPQIVYASGPPMTTLLAGYLLARRYRVPFVAEFRDRWVGDPYARLPRWRLSIDRMAERQLLNRTASIVTVSEPWADEFRTKYDGPIEIIPNGYDPRDFSDVPDINVNSDGALQIVYMGGIYPGRRDPTPLFRAVSTLGVSEEAISINFYGTNEKVVHELASSCGAEKYVRAYPRVSYRDSIKIQQSADVLFLMDYNDPRDYGSIPGKLFEYLAARRPILGTGLEEGLSARMIRERSAGLFTNDPIEIAQQLKKWIALKKCDGAIPALSESACKGLSRDEQYRKLEAFFRSLIP